MQEEAGVENGRYVGLPDVDHNQDGHNKINAEALQSYYSETQGYMNHTQRVGGYLFISNEYFSCFDRNIFNFCFKNAPKFCSSQLN